MSELDPRDLNARADESGLTNWHRLARSSRGTGRSNGSLLDDAAAALAFSPRVDSNDPESLKESTRQYRERTERALALEDAALEYQDAVRRAGVVQRRIERRQDSLRRAWRTQGPEGEPAAEHTGARRRSPGRMEHDQAPGVPRSPHRRRRGRRARVEVCTRPRDPSSPTSTVSSWKVGDERASSLRCGSQAVVRAVASALSRPRDERLPHSGAGVRNQDSRVEVALSARDRHGPWRLARPQRGDVLFSEVAEQWYATKLHLRESTRYLYRSMLDQHVLPTFGDRPVGSITTLDVQMWISDRRVNTRMGPNSVAKTYKVLRGLMEAALEAGLILRNPVPHQRCGHRAPPRDALPDGRADRGDCEFRGAVLAHADPARWVFRRAMGRARRVASPQSRSAAQDGARRRTVHAGARSVRVGSPKTAAGVRTVVLPPFICDVMVEHLARWSEPGVAGLVFVMPEGGPLRRENFRKRVWLPACAAAGIEELRFHDLRHTHATLAAASGAPLRAVMHRLGHASAAAALRRPRRGHRRLPGPRCVRGVL